MRSETPERNVIGHTLDRFKRAGVGTNGILECEFMSKNAHRTHSNSHSQGNSAFDAVALRAPVETSMVVAVLVVVVVVG
jgi:hypothetical protein